MARFAVFARLAITVLVTAGIFAVSANHIIAVAEKYGNHGYAAIVYPVCIDGLILVAALTMAARTGVSKETKKWCKLARYFGFAATIYANVAHSGYASTDAIVVNLVPALALILMMEVTISAVQMTPAARKAATRKTRTTTTRKLHAV